MNTDLCLAVGQWQFLCKWTKSRVSGSNAEESVLVWIIYSCADIYTALVGKNSRLRCPFDYGIASLFQDGEMTSF